MIVRGDFGDDYFLPYAPKILMQCQRVNDETTVKITDTGAFYVAFSSVYKGAHTSLYRYLVCRVMYKNLVEYYQSERMKDIRKDAEERIKVQVEKPSSDLVAYLLALCLSTRISTDDYLFAHEISRTTKFMTVTDETQYLPVIDNAEWLPVHMHAAIGTVYGEVLQEISNMSGVRKSDVDKVFDALHDVVRAKLYQSCLLGLTNFDFRIPYLCQIGMRTTAVGKKRLYASAKDMRNIHALLNGGKKHGKDEATGTESN